MTLTQARKFAKKAEKSPSVYSALPVSFTENNRVKYWGVEVQTASGSRIVWSVEETD